VLLGDVSGHGREALERAALMRYTLRAYLEAGLEPRATLKVAGRVLGEDANDAFATVAVAVFDASTGVFTYALAGHHAPIVLADDAPEPVGASASPPLGMGLPTGLRQTTICLPGDAVVCFFTDGLVEARAGDEMLGRERLAEALTALGPEPDAASLLGRVSDTADEAPDDVAACLVRLSRGEPAVPLRVEELELAPGPVPRQGTARFLGACGLAPGEIAGALDGAPLPGDSGAVMRVRFDERGTTVEFSGQAPDDVEVEDGLAGMQEVSGLLVAG
jgi:hypothetical protein